MTKLLKLLKLEFKNNMMLFIGFNIKSVIVLVLSCIISNLLYLRDIRRSYLVGDGNTVYVYDSLQPSLTMLVLVFSLVFVIIYTATSLTRKLSKSDGSVYSIMQLPVKIYNHIQATYISSLVFALFNSLISMIILVVYSRYLRGEMIDIVRTVPLFQSRIPSVKEILNKFIDGNPFFTINPSMVALVALKWILLISVVIAIVLLVKSSKNIPIYITALIIFLSFYSANVIEFVGWGSGKIDTTYIVKLIVSTIGFIVANHILIRRIEY